MLCTQQCFVQGWIVPFLDRHIQRTLKGTKRNQNQLTTERMVVKYSHREVLNPIKVARKNFVDRGLGAILSAPRMEDSRLCAAVNSRMSLFGVLVSSGVLER